MGIFSRKPKPQVTITVLPIHSPPPSITNTTTTIIKPPTNTGLKSIFSPSHKKSPSAQLLPGDGPRSRPRNEKITSEELRRLRDLVRQRYALDVEIWSLRKVGVHDQRLVKEKMARADALLARIQVLVGSFDRREYWNSDGEWAKWQDVKGRILKGGKRVWGEEGPWCED